MSFFSELTFFTAVSPGQTALACSRLSVAGDERKKRRARKTREQVEPASCTAEFRKRGIMGHSHSALTLKNLDCSAFRNLTITPRAARFPPFTTEIQPRK